MTCKDFVKYKSLLILGARFFVYLFEALVDKVKNNWLQIIYFWLWVALLCFGLFWFILNCCEFKYS